MVNMKYDYIVIGGGLNSLIAAALLAKKNNSVIIAQINTNKIDAFRSSIPSLSLEKKLGK